MRLNLVYFKRKQIARAPQTEEKVPPKTLLPLRLKENVYSKTHKNQNDSCLYEMSLLFKCWKQYTHTTDVCKDLERNLDICYQKYLVTVAKQKEFEKNEIPQPNATVLTNKQISYLLHQYPTV